MIKLEKPIALAADHGGFALKEAIKEHLQELGAGISGFWHCNR